MRRSDFSGKFAIPKIIVVYYGLLESVINTCYTRKLMGDILNTNYIRGIFETRIILMLISDYATKI